MIGYATNKTRMLRAALLVVACTALLAAGAGCGGGDDGDGAETAANDYVAATNARDWDRVCEMFSDSFKQTFNVTDNCPATLAELSSGRGRPTLKLLNVEQSGEGAIATVGLTTESQREAEVKVTLERQDGEWRIVSLGG